MAIDTTSLSKLISEFRKLQAKDSVTPESLGYILQRIADLLATAGTTETQALIGEWYNTLSKVDHIAVCKLQQGSADRNFVRLSNTFIDLLTGQQMTNENATVINMATTERAGVMKAQQVIDLNTARKNITELQVSMEDATNLIDTISNKIGLNGGKGIITNAQIAALIIDNELHVVGASNLTANGYVPYLFRFVRKRNRFKDRNVPKEEWKDYGPATKGWGVMGSIYTLRLVGSRVEISLNTQNRMCVEAYQGYSSRPEAFIHLGVNKAGEPTVGYGRSSVSLLDDTDKNRKKRRMIRLIYAVGFAKPIYPCRAKITPANLASSLAEFSIIYDTATDSWHFGK